MRFVERFSGLISQPTLKGMFQCILVQWFGVDGVQIFMNRMNLRGDEIPDIESAFPADEAELLPLWLARRSDIGGQTRSGRD